MKTIELYDGCTLRVETNANTVNDFLNEVPTRCNELNGNEFYYNGQWLPAFDLDFIEL